MDDEVNDGGASALVGRHCVVLPNESRAIVQGREVQLSELEVALLLRLARADAPLSNTQLLREVWGYSASANSRAVTVAVSRLRAKIELDPSHPRFLVTEDRRGYALRLVDWGDDGSVPATVPVVAPSIGTVGFGGLVDAARIALAARRSSKAGSALALVGGLQRAARAELDGLPPADAGAVMWAMGEAALWRLAEVSPDQLLAWARRCSGLPVSVELVRVASALLRLEGQPQSAEDVLAPTNWSVPWRGRTDSVSLDARLEWGWVLYQLERHHEAWMVGRRVESACTRVGDRVRRGRARSLLSAVSSAVGRGAEALQWAIDAAADLERGADRLSLGRSMHRLGALKLERGSGDGMACLEAALRVLSELGADIDHASVEGTRSMVQAAGGDLVGALLSLDNATTLVSNGVAPEVEAGIRLLRGRYQLLLGDLVEARFELERAWHLFGRVNCTRAAGQVQIYLGAVAHLAGELEEARVNYQQARSAPLRDRERRMLSRWCSLLDGARDAERRRPLLGPIARLDEQTFQRLCDADRPPLAPIVSDHVLVLAES